MIPFRRRAVVMYGWKNHGFISGVVVYLEAVLMVTGCLDTIKHRLQGCINPLLAELKNKRVPRAFVSVGSMSAQCRRFTLI